MNNTPITFSDFTEVSNYLNGLGLFYIHPSLDNITSILTALKLNRPTFTVIQVVGTNGKGSTSSMIASLAQAHNLKTGLFTSPHFISARERIHINGIMANETAWVKQANTVMRLGGKNLSYFEFIMAVAICLFAEENVDLAVIEAGLGGTWDATTALAADLTVITPIAVDHEEVLGSTLAAIAKDKAGAIRKNVPVCTAEQAPDAWDELLAACSSMHAPLTSCGTVNLPPTITDNPSTMLLKGQFQVENARLALLAWQTLQKNILTDVLREKDNHSGKQEENQKITAGLTKAWIPGRMQHVNALTHNNDFFSPCQLGWPPLILDGAHNIHAIKGLGHNLALEKSAPLAVIFSCLEDKNPDLLIPHLRALATGAIFVPPISNNPRAMSPEKLAKMIGVNATPAPSLKEALRMAATHMMERMPEAFQETSFSHPLLICGSLYLLGEIYALRPELLIPPTIIYQGT